jgi:hypothetical protein
VVNRQERDEEFPWLQELTDEQCLKIWRTFDRANDLKGWAPGRDRMITTDDEAIGWLGSLLEPFHVGAAIPSPF